MSRALRQALNAVPTDDAPALTPEAQAGFILGFVVVAFALLVLGAYSVFLTDKFKQVYKDMGKLEKRLRELELKDDDE